MRERPPHASNYATAQVDLVIRAARDGNMAMLKKLRKDLLRMIGRLEGDSG